MAAQDGIGNSSGTGGSSGMGMVIGCLIIAKVLVGLFFIAPLALYLLFGIRLVTP